MFNEVNLEDRLRQPVRGRVLVATTSQIVEFIEPSLTRSYPLFSQDQPIPEGYMLVFSAELNGELSFDAGSEYRIFSESANYQKLRFDPTAFAIVKAADRVKEFVPKIVEVATLEGSTLPIDVNTDYTVKYFTVRFTVPPNTPPGNDTVLFAATRPMYQDEFQRLAKAVFLNRFLDYTFQSYTQNGFAIYNAPGPS